MNNAKRTPIMIAAAVLLAAAAPQPADAQVRVGPVTPPIDRTLDRTLERLPRLPDPADDAVPDDALPDVPEAVEQAAAAAASLTRSIDGVVATQVGEMAGLVDGLRDFVVDVDPFGRPIEKNTLVVLVAPEQVAQFAADGFEIVAERALDGLGMTMLTLRAPSGYGLAERARELAGGNADATVDYNHLYRWQQGGQARPAPAAVEPAAAVTVGGLRLGLIDSAVQVEHPLLKTHDIVQRDFVAHGGRRPAGHGTAVASVLAEEAGGASAIHTASVFFQLEGHAPGATTESLLLALDWLVREQVHAINMSLAGPANGLLEKALARIRATGGPPVIAAVGNNGPAGEPLYPGAYDSVVGVTAVDRDEQVFRYANRGEHVDFAARGVDVKVADLSGGQRLESGTSMAAPRVTVIVAELARDGLGGEHLQQALVAAARDLGQPGFDPVYGFGLVTRPPSIASNIRTPQPD